MICGFVGVEDICHHRVNFEDLQGQVQIPGDGTPFIIIGTDVRECHHLSGRNQKAYVLYLKWLIAVVTQCYYENIPVHGSTDCWL